MKVDRMLTKSISTKTYRRTEIANLLNLSGRTVYVLLVEWSGRIIDPSKQQEQFRLTEDEFKNFKTWYVKRFMKQHNISIDDINFGSDTQI